MLVHWDEVEWARIDRGPLRGLRQRLGAATGAVRAGLSRYLMSPGERAMPVHVHADEEEIVYVLGGGGLSWQDGRAYVVALATASSTAPVLSPTRSSRATTAWTCWPSPVAATRE